MTTMHAPSSIGGTTTLKTLESNYMRRIKMTKYRIIRAFSYVYEVEADSATEAEETIIDRQIEPVEILGTDDIYTEEL
jgi:hypothetical protein